LGVVGASLVASSVQAGKEVDRIREKTEELASRLVSEQFSHLGEGKDSNLDRVYRDYDYLLKESKLEEIDNDLASATGDEKDQLERLRRFLVSGMILAPVAANYDNAESYITSAAMSVAGAELTLLSFESMLANEAKRSNRRIWYLASRDLQENANVFEINLRHDLDSQAMASVGTGYEEFLAESYGIDPTVLEAQCQSVLEATRDEYMTLLGKVVPEAIEDVSVEDLRQYDAPYLLRASYLDDTFKSGKYTDVLGKWLKDLGLDPGKQRKLRIRFESKEGMDPVMRAYPLKNGSDTRIAGTPVGGLPDYWGMAHALGEANFYYNIDKDISFEDQRVGSPLPAKMFGALFQRAMVDPAWQAKYLKSKQGPKVARALRFRELHDLRLAAAHYIFQGKLRADEKTPPTEYTALMTEAMGWTQGGTEETNYMLSSDRHDSGLNVLSVVYAAQLAARLKADYGDDWWAKREVGQWLLGVWEHGFASHSTEKLEAAWSVGNPDPMAVATP